jgi:EamA domain-containing membrane protein RarD
LSIIRIPQGRSPQRYILLTLFALVIGTNLFIPVNCLLPSHHPKALEPLGYIFLPLFELVVIALFIVAAIASDLLLRKDRKS